MYIFSKVQTRPSTSIPFYFEKNKTPPEFNQVFKKQFVDTKKIISSSLTYSDEKLTVTRVTTWNSKEAFSEFTKFVADPFFYNLIVKPNLEYDIENDITADVELIDRTNL